MFMLLLLERQEIRPRRGNVSLKQIGRTGLPVRYQAIRRQ
jgi:hypothetical protein